MNRSSGRQWQAAIDAARTAFFLDVDGTLLGFKDRPQDVVADADLIAILDRLREAASGAVALVSGRMIADLDRIVAPLVLPAAGVHGAELRFADGSRKDSEGTALADARHLVKGFVAKHAGLALEEKGVAIAIHYRHAPEQASNVAAFAQHIADTSSLAVQHGKFVVEIKASKVHKGDAIRTLLDTPPFVDRQPLFIGDDLTDEHAFGTVNRLGGISIKVGPDATEAQYRLESSEAVRRMLKAIVC